MYNNRKEYEPGVISFGCPKDKVNRAKEIIRRNNGVSSTFEQPDFSGPRDSRTFVISSRAAAPLELRTVEGLVFSRRGFDELVKDLVEEGIAGYSFATQVFYRKAKLYQLRKEGLKINQN